jgi:hypothetical protein
MGHLSLLKMSSGANVFEISDIQEDEAEADRGCPIKRSECNNITLRRKPLDGILAGNWTGWQDVTLDDLRRARERRQRTRERMAEARSWERYDADQRGKQRAGEILREVRGGAAICLGRVRRQRLSSQMPGVAAAGSAGSGTLSSLLKTEGYWVRPATLTLLPPCFLASYIALSAALNSSDEVLPC